MKVKDAIKALSEQDQEKEFEFFAYDHRQDPDIEEFWPITNFKEYKGKVIIILG